MKHSINKIAVLLLFAVLPAFGDEAKTTQGNAVVTVADKTYTLPIQQCVKPRTDTYEGETITTYDIKAFNAEANIKLWVRGTKDSEENQSTYKLDFDGGGLSENGASYSKQMPFDQFDGKSLHFKGVVRPFSIKNKDRAEVTVEITISCQ